MLFNAANCATFCVTGWANDCLMCNLQMRIPCPGHPTARQPSRFSLAGVHRFFTRSCATQYGQAPSLTCSRQWRRTNVDRIRRISLFSTPPKYTTAACQRSALRMQCNRESRILIQMHLLAMQRWQGLIIPEPF